MVTVLHKTDHTYSASERMKEAKQLGYPEECINDLSNAKSEAEITRIMINARHGHYNKKKGE